MSENIQSVNVEEIMAEIRKRIEERGDTSDMLSFDEATAGMEIQNGVSADSDVYSERDLEQYLYFAKATHNIPYYEPIPGNRIKVFVKRVFRKLMAYQLQPLRERQNHFNYNVIQSIAQLNALVRELEDAIIEKEAFIEELETRIEALEAR